MSDGQFSETKAEPYGIELPMSERPWSVRIPAAIAKAEGLVPETDTTRTLMFIPRRDGKAQPDLRITVTEVALAKALWGGLDWLRRCGMAELEVTEEALRDFTEKVESLGNE